MTNLLVTFVRNERDRQIIKQVSMTRIDRVCKFAKSARREVRRNGALGSGGVDLSGSVRLRRVR